MTDWHAALTARQEQLAREWAEREHLWQHPELWPDGDDDGTGPPLPVREYWDNRTGTVMYVG